MSARRIIAGAACLLAALLLRDWLEAAMLRHMLLQLPMIVAAGWLLAPAARGLHRLAIFDQHGVTGLTALLLVSAYWMIPRALELSITSTQIEAAKFLSLLALGAILPGSLQRANWIVQLFYMGNLCWMTAIAGIQYQNMPQRLCNAYLLDDQVTTGVALVAASIAIALVWGWRLHTTREVHHVTTSTQRRINHHAGPRIL
ncbi:hypothetical protein [Duganella rivi]|uniref:hypothetical protein n=1 Tax=Duganella rivi TaxID=2666083 RepID=UPI00157FF877|nr:hypothetical protein [Duganella rivi]